MKEEDMRSQEPASVSAATPSAGQAGIYKALPACPCCANGNDLPDGEYCRACGRENPPPAAAEPGPPADESPLARAVRLARGGPAPRPFRGFA
jgi:hypothetical protein